MRTISSARSSARMPALHAEVLKTGLSRSGVVVLYYDQA